MKNTITVITLFSIFFAGCNNSSNKSDKDSTRVISQTKTVTTKNGSIKDILIGYLQLKNALADDKAYDAADAGKMIVDAIEKFDTTSLSVEQKNAIKGLADDIKENALHCILNSNKIDHQRRHFEVLSLDMYDLLKVFKGVQSLYYCYCASYNNNLGAYWISETKEIKNPYTGKKKSPCGTIKEELN